MCGVLHDDVMNLAGGGGGSVVQCHAMLCNPTTKYVYAYEFGSTVNFANNDCGYNDNSRITTEFPCPEQSSIQLQIHNETSGITTLCE